MFELKSVEKKIAYSIEEISEQTSLSKAFLRNEIRANRLKVQKFGRRVIVLSEDLMTYLESGSEGGRKISPEQN